MASKLKTLAQGSVATAGTRVQLISSVAENVTKVYVSAGAIDVWIGDNAVAVNRGVRVAANTTSSFYAQNDVIDLTAMYADSGTSGATFSVSYLTRV